MWPSLCSSLYSCICGTSDITTCTRPWFCPWSISLVTIWGGCSSGAMEPSNIPQYDWTDLHFAAFPSCTACQSYSCRVTHTTYPILLHLLLCAYSSLGTTYLQMPILRSSISDKTPPNQSGASLPRWWRLPLVETCLSLAGGELHARWITQEIWSK